MSEHVHELQTRPAHEQETLMLRSVGAMAIAEGEEGWERVPIDCPMLGAVVKLRRDYDELRTAQPPPVALPCYDGRVMELEEHIERIACWRDAGDVLRYVRELRDQILQQREQRRASPTKGAEPL